MFSSKVPFHTIDLDVDEGDRWLDVIAQERASFKRVSLEARKDFDFKPKLIRNSLTWALKHVYEQYGGLYLDEIKSWADAHNLPFGEMIALNCLYEASHAGESLPFGCTAGARWIPGLGMVHVRNMDWPLKAIGQATRIFEFTSGHRKFISVGSVGHVGVLSGMLPGAYSVTMNWAPPQGMPGFDFGPAFLLRDALETCDTFSQCVSLLKKTKLSTSVFFLVCGVRKDEAVVIERTKAEASVRKPKSSSIVVANHFVSKKFLRYNDAMDDAESDNEISRLEWSQNRFDKLSLALGSISKKNAIKNVALCLDEDDVLNDETQQQMVFIPKTGFFKVWRWI